MKSVHDEAPTSDEVLHTDVIVVWTDLPHHVITGADILSRLLKVLDKSNVPRKVRLIHFTMMTKKENKC
jgi:hypothetical protein